MLCLQFNSCCDLWLHFFRRHSLRRPPMCHPPKSDDAAIRSVMDNTAVGHEESVTLLHFPTVALPSDTAICGFYRGRVIEPRPDEGETRTREKEGGLATHLKMHV